MIRRHVYGGGLVLGAAILAASPVAAQSPRTDEVTFTKDIAPILQRSCQACHRPNSLAPMSLVTYEDARPFARAIKQRTGLRGKQGTMPPWFIEKNIGVQGFKEDISLSEAEIAAIGRWSDNGAPRGNPADMPPARVWKDNEWEIGTPDLIVESPALPKMAAVASDWWGVIPSFPIPGHTEDRYVAALEIKEINDSQDKPGRATVGGLFIIHHAQMSVLGPKGQMTGLGAVHEVGRNADIFNVDGGRLLAAGSSITFGTMHLHSNGKETTARMRIGFKFHPVGYKPKYQIGSIQLGTGELDIPGSTGGVTKTAYTVLTQPVKMVVFEPHMHATGVRMCLDAIYPATGRVETINCSGYDHSWVKVYNYAEDSAPLLPRGTILRVTGYFDNTPANRNVVDPRNWSGLGHRSIDNMLLMLGQAINLTDEQFAKEVAERRTKLRLTQGQSVPGCPTCSMAQVPGAAPASAGQQQQ